MMENTVDSMIDQINAGNIQEDFLLSELFEDHYKNLRDEFFSRRREIKSPNALFDKFIERWIRELTEMLLENDEELRYIHIYKKVCTKYGIDPGPNNSENDVKILMNRDGWQ